MDQFSFIILQTFNVRPYTIAPRSVLISGSSGPSRHATPRPRTFPFVQSASPRDKDVGAIRDDSLWCFNP
jgi:hypothetical protein